MTADPPAPPDADRDPEPAAGEVARRVRLARGRLDELYRKVRESRAAPAGSVASAEGELSVTVEELQIAELELRAESERLAKTRAQLEAELRRQRALFEHAPDAHLVTTTDGTVLAANAAAGRLLDTPPAEITGRPLVGFVDEAARRTFEWELRGLAGSEGRTGWVIRIRPRDHEPRDVEVAVAVLAGGADEPHRLQWLMRDVTARVQAEAALHRMYRDTEQRLIERTAQLEWSNTWKDELLRREQSARAEAEAAHRELEFLSEASELLASSLDHEATLGTIADLAVPVLADWCIVDLEEGGRLRQMAAAHVDATKVPLIRELRRRYPPDDGHVIWRVLRSGEPEIVPDIPDSDLATRARNEEHLRMLRELGIRSHVVVPLRARGQILGVISLVFGRSGRRYEEGHLALARELARRCALALDNARLYAEAQDSAARHRQSLALLDTLLATAPVGLAFIDRDLRYARVNEYLAAAHGRPAREHVGRAVRDIVPELADALEPLMRGVLDTGDPAVDVEIRGETPAWLRETRDWLVSCYPVPGPEGRAAGVGVVMTDVTERRREERDLRAQFAVGLALAEADSVEEAAPAILAAVCGTFGWDVGALWVLDVESEALGCSEVWNDGAPGLVAETRGRTITAAGGAVQRALDGREPVVTRDLEGDLPSERAEAAVGAGMRWCAVVPLRVRRRVLGALELFGRTASPPDAERLRVLESLGSQVGQFIERKRAETERSRLLEAEREARAAAEAATQRLRDLQSIIDVGLTHLALDDLLQRLLERIRDVLRADTTTILLVTEDGRHLALRAVIGFEHDDAADVLIPIGRGVAGRIAETRRPLAVDDVSAVEVLDPMLRERGVSSLVGAPLMVEDRVIGVLHVGSLTPRRFSEEDAHLLELVADRAALAIDHARLYEAEREARNAAETARQRLAFLAEASEVLARSFDYQRTLDEVARLATLTLADYCIIDVIEESGAVARVAAHGRDPRMARLLARLRKYPPGRDRPNNPILQAIRTGRPVTIGPLTPDVIPALARDATHAEILERLAPLSSVCVPIAGRRGVFGAMTFCSVSAESAYGPEEIAVASDLARRAALAIDNAGLYDSEQTARRDAERAVERTAALQRITAALSEAVTPGEVASVVSDLALSATGADGALLAVVDEGGRGLDVLASVGYDESLADAHHGVELGAPTPLALTIRAGKPVFVESRAEGGDGAAGTEESSNAVALLPLVAERRPIGALAFRFGGSKRFDGEERGFLRALAQQTGQALDRTRLYERERRARADAETSRARLDFQLQASTVLARSLELPEILEKLGGVAVGRGLAHGQGLADLCLIDVVEDDGTVRRVVAVHADPAKQHLADRLKERFAPDPSGPHPAVAVMRSGGPISRPDMPEEFLRATTRNDEHFQLTQQLGFESFMCVPLLARGRVLGTITLVSTRDDRRYGAADVRLGEALAERASLAVENARLYRESQYVATTLQQSLLPSDLPEIPGLEVVPRYRAAGARVGGDFYDVFSMGEGEWGLVIGDVRGKGPDAAAVMGLVRHTIRAAAMQASCPSRILRVLNDAMRQQAIDERFATVAFVALRSTDDGARLTVCSGGHPLPLVLRAGGTLETIGRPGMLLGVLPEPQLWDVEAELGSGDVLLLYTDGVTEERSRQEFFGERRLASLLTSAPSLSAFDLADRIEQAVFGFDASGADPRDDIAFLVLRVPPAPA